jgi:hypothetical protein
MENQSDKMDLILGIAEDFVCLWAGFVVQQEARKKFI